MRCRIIPLFAVVASVPMVFGATQLSAQEAQRWTLEECIAYAFEHNIEVKQAELDVQNQTANPLGCGLGLCSRHLRIEQLQFLQRPRTGSHHV